MKKIIFLAIISFLFCSASFAEDITSSRAIEQFFKAHTSFRIADDSVEAYKTTLNMMSEKVISTASKLVKDDNRKTVLERDIIKASDDTFRRAPMTVDEILEKVKLLSIIELANFNKKINAYGDELLRNKANER